MWHWGRGGTVKRQEARLQPCLPLSPHRGINCMAGEVTGGGEVGGTIRIKKAPLQPCPS